MKRDAIERAALELFVEKGVDGTSIRDIAERSGVTEGALYRHHKGKDDLVRALFFEHYEGFADLIGSLMGNNYPFNQLIRELVETLFTFHDKDPYIFDFIILVRHKLLDEVRKDGKNPVELLYRIMESAAANGEIPEQDTQLTTQLMIGMVMQTVVGHHFGRVKGPLRQHSQRIADCCLMVAGAGDFANAEVEE
ncbi:MAG: TetR/AcrR family transcriptional regulator [Candidatus Sumerlaeia bacterium]|nr:TetR/AcrR family transcriptional regulator [Candidatus Sumerlaeia bacterium]